MAYDESLAQRMRTVMADTPGIVEKKMFGGVGFMLQGNMACGIQDEGLIVRVGPEAYEQALAQPYTTVFNKTGRPMTGWIVVAPAGYADDADLQRWVRQGLMVAGNLPAK